MAKTTDKDRKDWYLSSFEGFEKSLNGASKSPVHQIRRAAIDCFARSGFPTTRDEAWKHTNVAPLTRIEFSPVLEPAETRATAGDLAPFTFAGLECVQLVFVNGFFAPHLSSSGPLPDGVKAMSLAAALEAFPELVEAHLGHHAPCEDQGFAALNTAFIQDGAFLYIPADTALAAPFHLLFVSTAGERPTASHPRNLIVAGDNSQVSVIESYAGLQDQVYLTNAVTEVVVGENAVVEHCKIQRESAVAFHVATLHFNEARSCRCTSHNITLGGHLIRNDITTVLDGEAVESTLNGLYLLDGEQHVDNHTLIEHVRPHCTSHELYKGILDDQATGVFRGKIFVHQEAQKTDAYQSNQNLLLSAEADITSKPQLEIYADDVKCSHGSTTGQLDADAIFYLRSRGIGRAEAVRVLTRAFAHEILERIGIEPVRTQLDHLVTGKLEAAPNRKTP